MNKLLPQEVNMTKKYYLIMGGNGVGSSQLDMSQHKLLLQDECNLVVSQNLLPVFGEIVIYLTVCFFRW